MNTASVLQINVSKGGVPKRRIPTAVITSLGIDGDVHSNPQVHGGPRQAILLITVEGIEELNAAGFALYPGALGENITTQGLNRDNLRIGQRLRVGEVELQLTKLRSPCSTIQVYGANIGPAVYDAQVKAGDPSSPRWGLGGFYFKVVQAGTISTGDPITLLD
jgi:MOSC domain-containing protein YiiM